MAVKVKLCLFLVELTKCATENEVEGSTVGECFEDLFRQFPKLKELLMTKSGKLHRSYDVYINGESSYPKEMEKPVKDGDKLNIVFIVYGG